MMKKLMTNFFLLTVLLMAFNTDAFAKKKKRPRKPPKKVVEAENLIRESALYEAIKKTQGKKAAEEGLETTPDGRWKDPGGGSYHDGDGCGDDNKGLRNINC